MALQRIHHKLILYVLGLTSVLAIIAVGISFVYEFNRSKNKTDIMLNQLMDTVERTAAIAAYTSNTVIAEDVLNGLLRNDIVHKVIIRNDQSLELKKAKTTNTDKQTPHVRILYSPFSETEKIGQLEIYPATGFNYNEAKYAASAAALNSIILIAITTLIILLVVRSYISKPLSRVSDALHAIKAGEKKRIKTLSKNREDELGRLIEDINALLGNLNDKFKEEQSLRKEFQAVEQKLRHIFDSSSAGLFLLDVNGNLITYNSTLLKILHRPDFETATERELDFASEFFSFPQKFRLFVNKARHSGQLEAQDFCIFQKQDTCTTWVHCLLSKVTDAAGDYLIEGVVFDVTQRVASEQAIRHEADHDFLTNLLLRQAIKNQFEDYLLRAETPIIHFFLLDLDGFKQANDAYGHAAGDTVLIEIAKRLKSCLRVDDLISRFGGDEFLVMIFDSQKLVDSSACHMANNILEVIKEPIRINADMNVTIGASIGIASYPEHGFNFEDIVKSADHAMYSVKNDNKNGYAFAEQKSPENQLADNT